MWTGVCLLFIWMAHLASADPETPQFEACYTKTETMAFRSRVPVQKLLSVEQSEGAGARVRRSIGRHELRRFDPFLLLDEFSVGEDAGFPDHPHRGFETVTYMIEGSVAHEDFTGASGVVEAGDVQWMTAGRGIVHAEMPQSKKSHGMQLWINLAAKYKMVPPRYQDRKASEIPRVTKDGVTAIVIAGEALGIKSSIDTYTPTHYIHFKMEPYSKLVQPIPPTMNSFAYTLSGEAYFGQEISPIKAHTTIVLSKGGEHGLIVETKESPVDFVLISGEPLNEPCVQHGPFVMNTAEEIQQCFDDYRRGKNGFEPAVGFRSKIGGY
eukprot:m.63422 g.63422  ORF g.63422 m.63422 type:complete len:324 (-) comp13847_c0_seq2:317-1288(-)